MIQKCVWRCLSAPYGCGRTRNPPACTRGSGWWAAGCACSGSPRWRRGPSSSPHPAPRWERSHPGSLGRSTTGPESGGSRHDRHFIEHWLLNVVSEPESDVPFCWVLVCSVYTKTYIINYIFLWFIHSLIVQKKFWLTNFVSQFTSFLEFHIKCKWLISSCLHFLFYFGWYFYTCCLFFPDCSTGVQPIVLLLICVASRHHLHSMSKSLESRQVKSSTFYSCCCFVDLGLKSHFMLLSRSRSRSRWMDYFGDAPQEKTIYHGICRKPVI